MLRLQPFNNCRDSTWSSSGDGGRAPPPNSHCKWSSLFLFHSFEKAALPLPLLLQCLQSRRSILITGTLDFDLKWQRSTLLGLFDVILHVYKKGASREARLLQCSAAFVLEPSRRLCLSLFHKHRQTQVYLLDAVSRGSERSLCSFNPFIRSCSFCSHSVWLCDGIQMISASLCSVVRLTRAFQTVSSCDRQQTGSSSSLPVSLDVSLCLFFYIHGEEQMRIKDLNNRSQKQTIVRWRKLCEKNYYSCFILLLRIAEDANSTYILLRKAPFHTAVYGYVVCVAYLRLCAWHPMTSHNPPLSQEDYYLCWPGNCDAKLDAQEQADRMSRPIMQSPMVREKKSNCSKECLECEIEKSFVTRQNISIGCI